MKSKQVKNDKLVYLSPDSLLTHPKNLRRFYPEDQVREMAESIRASKGVYQALIIVPDGKPGMFYVVDGNVRHRGAKLLGKECPPLKCEVVSKSIAEQLLAMVVTAKFRYDPDAISEALHYKRLMDEEGYKVSKIAQETGVAATAIYTRLKLLELDSEIQELVGGRKLPSDKRAVEAFLSIPDVKARVKMAQRLARDGVTISTIVASCERLAAQLKDVSSVQSVATPAVSLGQGRSFGKTVPASKAVKMRKVRQAAKEMCEACDVKLGALESVPEPAWSLITHAADETCKSCNVRQVKNACNECPGVDIIRRLALAVGEKKNDSQRR